MLTRHKVIFMIFISMLHQHLSGLVPTIHGCDGTEASSISSWHIMIQMPWYHDIMRPGGIMISAVGTSCTELFLKKNSAPNSINTILTYALNNFEIGKVELVLNKLLIYPMALFNNA